MLFPPYACRIYPHAFRMTIGLQLLRQFYPTCRPCMRFLSVRPDFCRRLPSDSISRWTPLPLAICFPSLGRIGDFHPLEHAHAGRTEKREPAKVLFLSAGYGSIPKNSKREYRHFRFPERFPSTYVRLATEMNFLALVFLRQFLE